MRKIDYIIHFIGITCIELAIFAIFVCIFEYLGFIEIYIGNNLFHFSVMDTWLILILIVFFPLFLTINIILYKLKIIDLKEVKN